MDSTAPKPGKAFLLTLLGPGLGHLHAGVRPRGARAAVTVFALMILAVVLAMLPPVNLPVLLLMALSVLAIPLFQVAAAIDAARHAARSPAAGGSSDLFVIGTVVWLAALATFAGLLYAVTSLGSIEIDTDDMAPTLLQGDRVITWKNYYRDRLPERGDVAVVLLPGVDEPRAMRIVGLPGDSLLSVLGVLTVNGEAVEREKLGDFGWRDAEGTHRNAPRWREILPGGAAYEILQSAEGMFGGTLLGASLRIPDGNYFVIGDNRDKTRSSWDFGFLPGEVLSDRPTVILGSSIRSRIGRSVQP